jgi:phosphatidylethanolamine-binding protein (PEBP) family uncharacterized protein
MTPRPLLVLAALAAACASSPAPLDADRSDAIADAPPTDTPDVAAPEVGADTTESGTDATIDHATDASADASADTRADASAFALTSPAFTHQGTLPAEFTCDGVGHSPPLAWSGAPAGTAEYALLMTVLARDGLKWNWVLHTIPASAAGLATGATNVGIAGLTSDGPALAYSPPCSRGPGPMAYTFTLYALSGHPTLPARPNQVTGAVLTEAIASLTLASTAMTVTYSR